MIKDALYVIDMQEGFLYNSFSIGKRKLNNLIANAIKIIKHHMSLNHKIILVEYLGGYGPTIEPIKNILKGYKNVHTVRKNQDGGGFTIKRRKLAAKNCYVVGVNLTACVYSTCGQLSSKNRTINIYKNAAKNTYDNIEPKHRKWMKKELNCNFI